jgi:hypothetical protein
MFNAKQNELMLKAMDLLHEANCAVQTAMGASDECYEIHCAIENVGELVLEQIQLNNKVDA